MEVFVAEKGTWTIVITDLTGTSCIVAAGEAWTSDTIVAGEHGSES